MERNGRCWQAMLAVMGLLILIFDSALALKGARAGVVLCINTVIPSLFPFFVLSMVLTNTLQISGTKPVRALTRILGIPVSAAPVLIPAVLGGYPVGAKCVGDLYRQKRIGRAEAQRLLAFCSNAGPSFLFGMVSSCFSEQKTIWLLWFIHLGGAVLTAFTIPSKAENRKIPPATIGSKNPGVILSAAKAMTLVCCWIILFRMIITFLDAWFLWIFPEWIQIFVMGVLELTNGCCSLACIPDANLRFLLCSCMLSFGGICVLLQTASVIKGLSIGSYLKGKLIQTTFSFLLSSLFVPRIGLFSGMLMPILVIFFRKAQNRCGNPRMLPV